MVSGVFEATPPHAHVRPLTCLQVLVALMKLLNG